MKRDKIIDEGFCRPLFLALQCASFAILAFHLFYPKRQNQIDREIKYISRCI